MSRPRERMVVTEHAERGALEERSEGDPPDLKGKRERRSSEDRRQRECHLQSRQARDVECAASEEPCRGRVDDEAEVERRREAETGAQSAQVS